LTRAQLTPNYLLFVTTPHWTTNQAETREENRQLEEPELEPYHKKKSMKKKMMKMNADVEC